MELEELQKTEAIKRLQILQQEYKIHPNVINEFKQYGTVFYSERVNQVYNGILYWLSNEQKYVDAVNKIEEKYNLFVYHCILNHTEFGDWLSMLFVSDNPDNWEDERLELKSRTSYAYVYTFDEFNSEFGPIELAGVNGGLIRLH